MSERRHRGISRTRRDDGWLISSARSDGVSESMKTITRRREEREGGLSSSRPFISGRGALLCNHAWRANSEGGSSTRTPAARCIKSIYLAVCSTIHRATEEGSFFISVRTGVFDSYPG